MTSDIVAATLAGLGPMIAQGTRKPVDQYAARRAYGLRLLQQGSDTSPVKGGVVEGLARALQAGLGGYLTRRADEGQQAEDETQRSGLMAAIGQAQTSGDFSPVAQALARAGMTGQAASLMLMDSLAKRQAGQGAARVGAILGDGAPGSYPQRVSATESPNGATNPVSGASGFYQMMPRTAVALAKQTAWGASMSPEQILAVVRDPNRRAEQDELMKLYTAQSDATLTQAGIPVSDVSRFALHAFGPAGGVSLLKAPDNMPVDQWVRSVDWGGASPQQVIEQNGLGKYQTVGQLRQDFIARRIGGGNPQVAQGPAPAPVANPPQPPEMPNPGIMPQGAGNDPPMPGVVNPGFNAAPTVPLAPQARVDDGSQDMAIARRLLALPDPQSQAMAMKYLQSAQEKQARAQQFQMDLAGKDPPMLARAGSGIGVVEGAEDAQRRLAAAKAQGSAQGGGVMVPGVDPNTGAPGFVNPVTGEFKPSAAPFTEAQGRSATFADRMAASERNLREVEGQGTSAVGALLERLGGAGNFLQSPEYQRYEQARRDFINAQLRRESGAVISPEEFANAEKQYFPRPGDSPAVIEQKRRNRQIALEGMARDSGPAYKPREAAPQAGNDTLQQARDAIARGAPRERVIERLRSMGVDPGGL